MRVLITGITSFLGLYTARLLLQEGHTVIGAVRPGSRRVQELASYGITAYPRYRTISLDLNELPEVELGEEYYKEVLDRTRTEDFTETVGASIPDISADPVSSAVFPGTPTGRGERKNSTEAVQAAVPSSLLDAWIHFAWDGVGSAGRSDVNLQIENIENAKKAYLYAKLLGARKFLFAGSQAEYGRGNHRTPLPVSAYGKAKLAFGRWATEQSLLSELYDEKPMQFIHMRIYSVYGKGDHETSLVNSVLKAALHHETMTLGPCTQRWNYLEVHDLARAVRILLESEDTRTDIYDIAGSDSRTLKSYVLAMHRMAVHHIAGEDTTARTQAIGAELQFGTRANNAEGAADMSPNLLKIQRLGFHQEISFEAGIGMLLREMEEAKTYGEF